jgi:phage FluMu gp28-like protein
MVIPLKALLNLLKIGDEHFKKKTGENLVSTFMISYGYHMKIQALSSSPHMEQQVNRLAQEIYIEYF